jgi:hypothetical protein
VNRRRQHRQKKREGKQSRNGPGPHDEPLWEPRSRASGNAVFGKKGVKIKKKKKERNQENQKGKMNQTGK